MSWQASGSDDHMSGARVSTAFELLHPEVQRWIWLQNWTELREVQEEAVKPILRGDTDVILAGSTACRKPPVVGAAPGVPN
jgi:hypothetical protein